MKRIISLLSAVVMLASVFSTAIVARAADFSETTFTVSKTSFVYTGSAIVPAFSLTKDVDDGTGVMVPTPLVEGVDYEVACTNNVKTGIATMTITGLGDYAASQPIVQKYTIKPKKASTPSVVKTTTDSIEIKWTAAPSGSSVSGYKVYQCDSNGANAKRLTTTTKTSYKVTKLKNATKYNYKVVAYKKSGDTTIDGEASSIRKTATKPKMVQIKSISRSKDKKSMTVKWAKTSGSGYQIEYSTKSDMSNPKTITIKDSSKVSKKISIDAKKTYYVKVRAFKEYDNGKYNYGNRSIKLSTNYNNTYSTYSSSYVNNANRTTNLRIASKAINGTVLEPGQTFSFNKVVGERTTAKGYKAAHVFSGPSTTVMGVGGGVCQVASTMFNAALLGNFKIVERHQHSQRVSYVPLGRDAAIYWGSQDFKFQNNTSNPVKIYMGLKDGKIYCTIKTCTTSKPKKVTLKVSRSGNNFTLKRYVGGKVNYTTKSRY